MMKRLSRWVLLVCSQLPLPPEQCLEAARLSGTAACCEVGQHTCALTAHPTCPTSPTPFQEFYTDLKDAEREGEVNRILSAFKLNPYEQMNLHNDATPEEVRRQYRKVRALLWSLASSLSVAAVLVPLTIAAVRASSRLLALLSSALLPLLL